MLLNDLAEEVQQMAMSEFGFLYEQMTTAKHKIISRAAELFIN